jgi:hypothetical protein
MSRFRTPVLVRLLMCAALLGVSASATRSGQTPEPSVSVAATDLPINSSFSGYIIAVG